MKLAQNSEPVKSPFHKSDISKQSTGSAALQMHAISGSPRICEMSISWSSSPGRASQSAQMRARTPPTNALLPRSCFAIAKYVYNSRDGS